MENQLVTTRTIGSSQALIPNSMEMGTKTVQNVHGCNISPLVNNNSIHIAQNASIPGVEKTRHACFAALDLYYSNEHDDSLDFGEADLPFETGLHTNASASDGGFYQRDIGAPNAKRMRMSRDDNEMRQVQWSSKGHNLAKRTQQNIDK